jgi:hypothetical protein
MDLAVESARPVIPPPAERLLIGAHEREPLPSLKESMIHARLALVETPSDQGSLEVNAEAEHRRRLGLLEQLHNLKEQVTRPLNEPEVPELVATAHALCRGLDNNERGWSTPTDSLDFEDMISSTTYEGVTTFTAILKAFYGEDLPHVSGRDYVVRGAYQRLDPGGELIGPVRDQLIPDIGDSTMILSMGNENAHTNFPVWRDSSERWWVGLPEGPRPLEVDTATPLGRSDSDQIKDTYVSRRHVEVTPHTDGSIAIVNTSMNDAWAEVMPEYPTPSEHQKSREARALAAVRNVPETRSHPQDNDGDGLPTAALDTSGLADEHQRVG